jgi:hypothetical protein
VPRAYTSMNDLDTTDAWWAQLESEQQFQAYIDRHTTEEPMPLTKDMIQSKYVAKGDFEDEQTCTIRGVKEENLAKADQPDEMRWVLYFRDAPVPKGMVMNVTTIRVLEQAFGGDTDDWVNKKVIVYVDPNVSFGGKVVGGLRLRIPKQKAAPAPSNAAPQRADGDPGFDDQDIPF